MNPRIYLDIDGVLNSKKGDKIAKNSNPEEYQKTVDNVLKYKHLLYKFWDSEAVSALKFILSEVKCDIYIHSTWKHQFTFDELKSFFEAWGIDSDLIKGIVPQYKMSSLRCNDLSWHIEGDRTQEDDQPACHNFVILDDHDMKTRTTYKPQMFARQIVIDEEVGLTKNDAYRAINLLKGNTRQVVQEYTYPERVAKLKGQKGHHYMKEYTETTLFCPFCGHRSVWREEGEGDYYEGNNYVCTSCSSTLRLDHCVEHDVEHDILFQISRGIPNKPRTPRGG